MVLEDRAPFTTKSKPRAYKPSPIRITDGLSSFDLPLPTECDDEYWLTPDGEPLFKQPPGKPSKVSAFVCMIRLGQIVAFAMRTIVSSSCRFSH